MSHDYVLRRMSHSVTQPPIVKGDVTDAVFTSIISVTGDHQAFIDICHCRLVNAPKLKMLGMCVTLNYLDVSHTNIRDIDPIINNCLALRSLNLAGIDLYEDSKYQALGKVVNIEILSLSHALSLKSIDFCKHLLMLRSLSLTNTEIASIAPLGGNRLTRLEELSLDSCRKLDCSAKITETVDTLKGLPALQLLNAFDIKCVNEHADFILDFHPNANLLIETKPRKILLLEAIMLNDLRMVRHCLATGCDVNQRTAEWAEDTMLCMWRRLCKKGRLQSPCFLVSHEEEELRPTPLHFAMMFGHVDIVKVSARAHAGPTISHPDPYPRKGNCVAGRRHQHLRLLGRRDGRPRPYRAGPLEGRAAPRQRLPRERLRTSGVRQKRAPAHSR